MSLSTRELIEATEACGEDPSFLEFLSGFYCAPSMLEEIGAPAGCRHVATLDRFATEYIMAPLCYLTYADGADGVRYFTLKNRTPMTLAPTLHSLWAETLAE